MANKSGDSDVIKILLVDDIPETRENIKKLLAFEPDFSVVGAAGTGLEGVALAKETRPDIIVMDINMPDMDGIQATTRITEEVPSAAVIMMSAHGDPDYLRRAMLAGARDFLTKPPDPDELYNTIRAVYKRTEHMRAYIAQPQAGTHVVKQAQVGTRLGRTIAVYSPQGGAGCTTIATNLASALMKEDVRVLLLDADLQFGDVGLFLNLQAQSNLTNLVGSGVNENGEFDIEIFDSEMFENIVLTHDSGLRVLLGPSRPEFAEEVTAHPAATGKIIERIAQHYDYIIIDLGSKLDDVAIGVLDAATRVVLVANPTLISLKNMRMVLDLFDNFEYPEGKVTILLNRFRDEKASKQLTIIPVARIESYLKRPLIGKIPLVDERIILQAIASGVPVIAATRDRSKSPIKEILEFAEHLEKTFKSPDDPDQDDDNGEDNRRIGGLRLRLGRS